LYKPFNDLLEKLLGMLVSFVSSKHEVKKDVFIDGWIGQWKA